MDDQLAKTIKVIRLKNIYLGRYLTASDDQVSVTLTTRNSENYNSKDTEWRLEWLKSPKNLVGQVRLWSIYNKTLTFTEDDPGDYQYHHESNSSSFTDELTQQSWPPPSDLGEAASEWQFEIRNSDHGVLDGDLLKWSENFSEWLALTANNELSYLFKRHHNTGLLFRSLCLHSWYIEVVVKGDDNVILTPSTVSQTIPTSPYKAGHCQNTDCYYGGGRFMHMLSRWQVGQVIFNAPPTSAGFHTSNGYKNDLHINSGGNINESGDQKNGDINLYNETNRSRDNNVIFVNYLPY